MSYGVTPEGYVLKTQAVVNAETEEALKLVIDPETGDTLQVALDASDIVAQVTLIPVEGVGDGLAENQVAFNQFDPAKATGASLSGLIQLNGLNRKSSTPSSAQLTFTGNPLANFDAGIIVTDQNANNNWATLNPFALDGFGTATEIAAECTVVGAVIAVSDTLDSIVTPKTGLHTVTNPLDAVVGNAEEPDTQARLRRDNSTEAPSIGLPSSLSAALLDVTDVTFARVYNNVSLDPDSNGIPGKAVSCVVVGGSDNDIALLILSRWSAGASFFGNTTVNLVDAQGFITAISFIRPFNVPIYVIVNLTVLTPSDFPQNGADLIKQNIVDYSIGGAPALGITDGFSDVGFQPGGDIIQSRLYTPVNQVPGHTIDSIFIGTAPAPVSESDLAIDYDALGVFTLSNIVVNLV